MVRPPLRAMMRTAASVLMCAALLNMPCTGCRKNGPETTSPGLPAVSAQTQPSKVRPVADGSPRLMEGLQKPSAIPANNGPRPAFPTFREVHEQTGLSFVYDNGTSRAKLMLESTAGGSGWLDYDMDGWWDVYLPQGGNPFGTDERRPSRDELYRNIGGTRFDCVSDAAIPADAEFGHGIAVGDFNDDGFDDVYVTNVGANDFLHLNCGDGTFLEVTAQAGVNNGFWATSAAWGDLDQDGDLDLYVCNYVLYDPRDPIACLSSEGQPGICHPKEVEAAPNQCYFNQGDGTFLELAQERGLDAPDGKSLALVIADLDGDALPDVFVANDTTANHLFRNLGNGMFREQGLATGCAMSGMGHYQASMGVGFGDYDDNGYPDLYVTAFTQDSNALYANFGPQGFEDVTRKVGLHLPTYEYLAFGTVMADFDFNGRQDLIVANGHIDDWRKLTGDMWYMRPQMFTYDGTMWHECDRTSGEYFGQEWLGRAVTTADYDNDLDLDVLIVHQNDPVGLLRNDSKRGHGLVLRFLGTDSNRRGIGVHVTVVQAGRRLVQELPAGTSYCASQQPALFFGLGECSEPCDVEIRWPSGRRESQRGVAVDQSLLIDERRAEEL